MDPTSYGDQRIQPIIEGIDSALQLAEQRGVGIDPAVRHCYEALKRDPNLSFEQLVRAVGLLYKDMMSSIAAAIDEGIYENGVEQETELVLSKIVHIEQIIDQYGQPSEPPDEPA